MFVLSFNSGSRVIFSDILVPDLVQNSGQIAPLDEIVKLKEKYRFRIILDESHSFGVLGNSGRGLAEQCGVPVSFIYLLFRKIM